MKLGKKSLSPIALVSPPGGRELTQLVDKELIKRRYKNSKGKTFIVPCECPRFANGEAKAVLYQSIRGCDVYIIADIGNYGCKFTIQGIESPMSPDDHF
ncbi:MAG: ribose-phosphate pyrophosphokinase-like domain-containing protein, partial [candidate division WOR-3 bacterium]